MLGGRQSEGASVAKTRLKSLACTGVGHLQTCVGCRGVASSRLEQERASRLLAQSVPHWHGCGLARKQAGVCLACAGPSGYSVW